MVVPVLVGVGRTTQRPQGNLECAMDPIQLAQVATEEALSDAQVGAGSVDAVMFVDMLGEFRLPRKLYPAYDNPGLSLARAVGMDRARCFKSDVGGNQPQLCINKAAEMIARGEIETCVVAGAEAIDTLERALKQKFKLSKEATSQQEKRLRWGDKTGVAPEQVGPKSSISTIQDLLHDLTTMPIAYALLEEATRRTDGVSHEERNRGNARMFHGFSKVSAYKENEAHSWFPQERAVDEIEAVSEANRLVAYPYNKLNCSIMDVNQGASVVLMSDKRARELGVPEEKWVYLHGSADCVDVGVQVLAKPRFDECPGMRIVGEAVVQNANVPLSRVSFYDVYSCFPIAVRMACREMGIPLDPETDSERLTVTGGLPFHGGPGNNYVLHSVAAMVGKLRQNRGKFGLVTANGGVLSKHSAGIYSTTPYAETHPDHPDVWTRPDCGPLLERARLATPPRRSPANPGECSGRLTSYSIKYGRGSKPLSVIAVGDITDGQHSGERFVARSEDPEVVRAFSNSPEAFYGRSVSLTTKDVSGKGKAFLSTFAPLADAQPLAKL